MSSMDGLRRQLANVQGELRDVVGRLDALEGQAVQAQTKPLAVTTPTGTTLVEAKPMTTTTPSSRRA